MSPRNPFSNARCCQRAPHQTIAPRPDTIDAGAGTTDCTAGPPRLPHMPCLDGLRALAVGAVLLYHAGVPGIPGGFLGVEVFFTLSGYLITSLLLAERAATGSIDLAGFWLRRARRLLPALFAVLAVTVGYAVLFLPDELAGLRGDAASGLLYANNWYQVFARRSYFESMGRPSLLQHLWSLSVEEQFYLLWPPAFCLLARLRRPFALVLVLAGGAASAFWMAALYRPDADPTRVYYGTDTRAAGILIGAALAWVIRPVSRSPAKRPDGANAAGLIALSALLACAVGLDESREFLYRGGFAVTALATAALIAATVLAPASWAASALAWPPLRWIGARSYGLYLWHYPVFMVTRPQLDVALDGPALLTVRLGLTLLLAACSYTWLELPVRNGAFAEFRRAWQAARGAERRLLAGCGSAVCLALAGVAVMWGVQLSKAKPAPPPPYLADLHAPTPPATNAIPPRMPPAEGVTAVGDSVMLGVRDPLLRMLGTNVWMDAEPGRQPRHVPAVLERLRAEGRLHPVVILHVGDNGVFTAATLGRIMAGLREARLVLVVNLKVPRSWEASNNAMLERELPRYPNAVRVDWHAAGAGRPELFWHDGLHLRPEGALVYADLLTRTLRDNPPQQAEAYARP